MQSHHAALPWIFYLIVLVVVPISLMYRTRRSQAIVQEWASRNSFELQECRVAFFNYGPYWWKTGKNQSVCRFVVRDHDGQTYSGWARCGSFWLGMSSEAIDVTWDSPSPGSCPHRGEYG